MMSALPRLLPSPSPRPSLAPRPSHVHPPRGPGSPSPSTAPTTIQPINRRALRHALASPAAEAPVEEGVEGEGDDQCSILSVRINNAKDPKYTHLTIDVQQYPGLVRTVTWTLNGLGIRAQNATMRVDEDGYSSQAYWLADLKGNKLSDDVAHNVQDCLQDLIQTCMPSRAKLQEEWDSGDVFVSNKSNDKYTEVIIKGEPEKPGFLLEVVTVMSAIGANVHESVVQGDSDFHPLCSQVADHDFQSKGRIFRFLLTEGGGSKLSPGRVAAILYTLDLVAGKGYQPTSPAFISRAK